MVRTGTATPNQILDVAERLAQTRGFNGFSYADISAEVGITKASLHYHFPTKADLGRSLIARYSDAFSAALEEIAAGDSDALARLTEYVRVYQQVLNANRMCLCGMLAAEYETLPPPMQQEIRRFFDRNEEWLVDVLEEGRRNGSLHFAGAASDVAGLLTGTLEGSMLLARSYGDTSRLGMAAERLLTALTPR